MQAIHATQAILNIELPEEIALRLAHLARETGRTQCDLVLEAIEEQLEDIEDLRLAEAELDRLERGETRTYTSAEVWGDLAD